MEPDQGERGVALLLVLAALVSLSALVALLFILAHQEVRLGRAAMGVEQARAVAEGGAALTLAAWDEARVGALMPGDSVVLPSAALTPAGWFRGQVRRLGPDVYLVQSTGTSRDSSARLQTGLLVRLQPGLPPPAALAARRVIGPANRVSGLDWPVPSLSCGGGENTSAIAGPNADLAGSLAALARRADVVLPHRFAGPVPATATPWPTILAEGDLTITGGQGRGTLLVVGNLGVEGRARFSGAVLAGGSISFGPEAGYLVGLVVSDSVNLVSGRGAPGIWVQYSSCYATIAWGHAAIPSPFPERAWFHGQ